MIIDCDTHCYETRDAFTRYLPEKYQEAAITTIRDHAGVERVLAGSRVATFLSERGLGFDAAYRPGSLKEMLRQMGSGNPDETYQPIPMDPAFVERGARVARLDELGVAQCVVYPSTLALSAEHYMTNTDALYANLHSFNRWFDETWGFSTDDRIRAAAIVSLRDLDRAVALTEEVIERGAKLVLLPSGPAYGRSPGDPYFDPVWSRLNEAGVTVTFHIQPFWYFDHISPAWGHDTDPAPWSMSAWQWMNAYGERPIMETLSALIFDNVFGRFPNLMVLVAEHGAEWTPHFVRHMDKSRGMGRNGPWVGGRLSERPSAIYRRHVRVVPYPEDDVAWIVENLQGAETLVMGSDYPHAEGVAEPAQFLDLLGDLGEDMQRAIMHDNADALLNR